MLKLCSISPTSSISSRLFKLACVSSVVFFMSACSQKTPEEHMLEAAAFAEAGNTQAAVVSLKNAVQLDSRSSAARFALGKLYLEVKDFESAEKELSRAKELGYDEGEVVPLLALALQKTGANVAMNDLAFDKESLTNADQMEVGFRKVESLVQLNKLSEANDLIRTLLLLDTNTVYKGLVQAYQDMLDEKPKDALDQAVAMFERAPLNSDVLHFTARLYQINGENEKATEIYENYIAVEETDLEAKFSLASMLVEQRKPEQAEPFIDELLLVIPENPLLNQLKSIVRASASDFESAKFHSEKAISSGRADPALRLIAGFSSHQLKDYEAAVNHLTMISSILPDNHPGLRILAASQLQGNMGDDAGEILARVNDTTSKDASLFSRAGYELIRSGDKVTAKEIIEQAGKISETSADLTRLGILKLSINDAGGIKDLESAVEKAPDSVTAKTTLASAYLNANEFEKSMALAKQWQKDAPSSVEGFLLEAEVFQRQAKYTEAQAAIDKAVEVDAQSAPVKLAQIRLRLREENFDDALAETEALLALEPYNLTALSTYFAIKNETSDPTPAIDKIRAAAKAQPDDANIALLLARIAISIGKADEALNAMQNIAPNRQAPPSFWQIKGLALLRNDQTDEALKHYIKWAELYPNKEDAVMGQLLILEGNREYERGARVASDYLMSKKNLQIQVMQSYFMVMAGDASGSKRVVASLDDKYQALPFVRGVKARIAVAEGRGGEAAEDAQAAYEGAKSADNLFVLIRTLDLSSQSDKVLGLIEGHVKEFPTDGRARLLLAERQILLEPENALASYESLLKAFPNNFVVLNNAAHLLMKAGNLSKASEYSTRAFAIQPQNVAIADTHAQILLQQGNPEEALEIYTGVMNNKVRNEEIWVNYIEVLLMNDSKALAQRRIKDVDVKNEELKERLVALEKKYL